MARSQDPEREASKAPVKIQAMAEAALANLFREATKGLPRQERDDPINVGIVAQQGDERSLGKHRHPSGRMAMPDSAEQRSGEKYIADRAEPDDENIQAVGHGVKVKREP
jgi:hypothetical protein